MKMTMKRAQLMVNGALTLMILAACSPGANLNGNLAAPQSPAQNQVSTQNQASAAVLSSAITNTSSSNIALQQDLTQVHDDEAAFADSLTIASESGFSTKMLEGELEAETSLETEAEVQAEPPARPGLRNPQRPLPPTARPVGSEAANQGQRPEIRRPAMKREILKPQQARERFQQAKEKRQEHFQDFRRQSAKLSAHAAITFNDDGSLTLDPRAFFNSYKDAMANKKMKFEKHLDKAKDKLKANHELKADKKQKLKRKNFLIKHSDKVTTENADGSVTDTFTAEFNNDKGVSRKTFLAITKMGDKVILREFKLEAKTPAYERQSTRVETRNDDGSVTILMDSKTSWKNGKTREMHQERLRSVDGQVSGTGTIIVTLPDGTVKTKTMNVTIEKSGEMNSVASEENSSEEVAISESAAGEATVIVENEDGSNQATSVDLEAEAEVIAEADVSEVSTEAEVASNTEAEASAT